MTSSDDPAYFPPGTAVAAKFKGAFCAAVVKTVKKLQVRVKATVVEDQRTVSLDYEDLRLANGVTSVKSGETVEATLPDSGQIVSVTVLSVKDNSEYRVIFNDGDEKDLRRSQILPQSPPSFSEESKYRDEDPRSAGGTPTSSTHSRMRSSRPVSRASSDRSVELDPWLMHNIASASASGSEDKNANGNTNGGGASTSSNSDNGTNGSGSSAAHLHRERAATAQEPCGLGTTGSPASTGRSSAKLSIGDAVVVYDDKTKRFPGLVVSHRGFKTADINLRREIAVRSFKDGRTIVSKKKDVQLFDRSSVKVSELSGALKIAVEKCLQYLDQGTLPPHWDKAALLRKDAHPETQSSSDEELPVSQEERDRFVAYLYKFMDERGTPINKQPTIGSVDLDLYRLHAVVHRMGGCNRITKGNEWKTVLSRMKLEETGTPNGVKAAYMRYLSNFDAFYRKLGIPADEINRVYLAKVPGSATRHPSGAAGGPASTELDRNYEAGVAPSPAKGLPDRRLLPMSVRRTMNLQKKNMRKNQASRRLTASWLTKARRVLGGTRISAHVAPPSRPSQSQGSPATALAAASATSGVSDRKSVDKRAEASEAAWMPLERHDGLWVGRMVKIKYGMGDMKRNYQAKIMKIETNRAQSAQKRFYVHYFGWNSRYDEYVDRSRIMLVTQKDDGNKFATSAVAERKILLAAKSPIVGPGTPALCSVAAGPSRARRESGKPPSVGNTAKSAEASDAKREPIDASARKRRLSSLSQNQADKEENGNKRPRSSTRKLAGGPSQTPIRGRESTPDVGEPSLGGGDDSDISSAETDSIRSWGKASSAPSRPSPRFTPSSYEMPAVMEEYAAQEANRWVPSRSESAPRTRQRRTLRRRNSASKSKLARPTNLGLNTTPSVLDAASVEDKLSIDATLDTSSTRGGCTPGDEDEFDEPWASGAGGNGGVTEMNQQQSASGGAQKVKKPPPRKRRKRHSHMPTPGQKRGGRTPRHQSDPDDSNLGGKPPGASSPPYGTSTAALRQKIISEMNSDPNYPPSKYSFDVFDPELKGEEKVNVCLQRLNQIREIYHGLKAQLAELDRRRRKTVEKKKKQMKKKLKEQQKKEKELAQAQIGTEGKPLTN